MDTDDDPTEEIDTSKRYYIIRMFVHDNKPDGRPNKPRRMARQLTLAEMQAWCRSPEASSRTCTTATSKAQTKRSGAWWDGFEEEEKSK